MPLMMNKIDNTRNQRQAHAGNVRSYGSKQMGGEAGSLAHSAMNDSARLISGTVDAYRALVDRQISDKQIKGR